jgi:phenolic acid decarboxylase
MKTFIIGLIAFCLVGCNNSADLNSTMPDKLVGTSLKYSYSGGNGYQLKFEEGTISYQFKSGSKPDKWWGKFKYNHLITENNEHLVSWHEPDYGDYITLLIDFENRSLYGSGIIANKTVHFQQAEISEIKVNNILIK